MNPSSRNSFNEKTNPETFSPARKTSSYNVFLGMKRKKKVPSLRKSFSEKDIETVKEKTLYPNAKMEDNGPLITLISPNHIKINSPGYLELERYDKVTILKTVKNAQGYFMCRSNKVRGIVIKSTLQLDQHSSNIYLQALDLFLSYPNLLKKILEETSTEQCKTIVSLLSARKILPLILKNLFLEEVKTKIPFRDQTPSSKFASTLLNATKGLMDLRTNLVNETLQIIRKESNEPKLSPENLVKVLDKCCNSYILMTNNNIPNELIVILHTVNDVTQNLKTEVAPSIILSTLFFLLYLNPGLVQPRELCNIQKITHDEIYKLKQVAQGLQILSNDAPLARDHILYAFQEKLHRLCKSVNYILNSLAIRPIPSVTVANSLIVEAASFYGLIMKIGRQQVQEEKLQNDLNDLEALLGDIKEAPRINEIDEIEKILMLK
jgi:hypothetical protein